MTLVNDVQSQLGLHVANALAGVAIPLAARYRRRPKHRDEARALVPEVVQAHLVFGGRTASRSTASCSLTGSAPDGSASASPR